MAGMDNVADSSGGEGRRPDPTGAGASAAPGVDLGVLIGALLRRAWLIVIAAVVGALLGLVWHQLATPWYESVTVVAPVEGDIETAGALAGPLGLANLAGIAPAGQVRRKDEAIATLKSRAFLTSFVQDLDLMPVLFSGSGGLLKRFLPGLPDRPPSLNDAADLLNERVITVTDDRRTGLVRIRVAWKDPDTTVRWASDLVSRVNREMQARARDRAGREMEFLRKELEGNTAIEVRQAIFRLMETQLKTMMLANVSDEFALRVVDPPVAPDPDRPISLSWMARAVLAGLAAVLLTSLVILGQAIGRAIRH
jgi:uncharacterized protein involved in exopolysaccharide biosynthesis